ncbi:ABC transporter permease [Salinibacterium sp. GXW1014]|uniref:ABC transporter permease n=1 Tax=Salinibacterium sp. GXW1014 TaxID=3377838 RepID=UPI00383B335D
MLRQVVLRLLTGVVVVLGAATVTFAAVRLIPGDIALAIAGGPETQPTPEVLEVIRAENGLNEPLITQYLGYLGRLLTGDLGTSYRLGSPVAQAIGEQVGATLLLAGAALLVAVVISFTVALLTAGRSRRARGLSSTLELLFASTPTFWLGLILLSVFSYWLGWLPSISSANPLSLILPAVTLGLPIAGLLTQVLRGALEDALEQPFIVSARARGLGETGVRVGHALRHSLVPYLTMSGFVVGALLGGAVITETLFARQGIGRLLLTSVLSKDLPVVIGIVLLSAAVFTIVNLAVDLVHPLLDRRLKAVTL